MHKTPTVDRVNIYRVAETWCYSAWIGCEFDHSDTLESDCEDLAREEVEKMFPHAQIRRTANA